MILLAIIFSTIELSAQVLDKSSAYPKAKYYLEDTGAAIIEEHPNLTIQYDYIELSPECNLEETYQMTLQVGDKFSYYRDYKLYAIDYLTLKEQRNLTINDLLAISTRSRLNIEVFRNNGSSDFETQINLPGMNLKHYETINIDWQLENDESEEFCGYLCKKATAQFKGKNWTAWYTEDIPADLGPWKLSGLPGLILYAYDNDNLHTFKATGITTNEENPICRGLDSFTASEEPNLKVFNTMYNEYRSYFAGFILKYLGGQLSEIERQQYEDWARTEKEYIKCYYPIE